jgi:nitrile hydratase accessory protein
MTDDNATKAADFVRVDPSLPRRNGELVFAIPSEGRAFGLALALHEREQYEWPEFQGRLIKAIAAAENDPYYEQWLAALERLVVDQGLVRADEVDRLADEFLEGRRELTY